MVEKRGGNLSDINGWNCLVSFELSDSKCTSLSAMLNRFFSSYSSSALNINGVVSELIKAREVTSRSEKQPVWLWISLRVLIGEKGCLARSKISFSLNWWCITSSKTNKTLGLLPSFFAY